MLSSLRKCHLIRGVERAKVVSIFASTAVLAGCSADVARFDLGSPEGARSGYASSGTSGRPYNSEYGSAGYDRPAPRGNDVARSDLPPTPQAPLTTAALRPEQQPPSYNNSYGQQRQPSYSAAQQQPAYAPPQGGYPAANSSPNSYSGGSPGGYAVAPPAPATASGETVEVRPGDTLYSLSRRHGVSVNALKSANGLTSNGLHPGQQLRLPAPSSTSASASVTARPPRESYEATPAAPVQAAVEAPSEWNRTYTVRQGDSLYAIARQNGVKLADLERYNGIADSRKVKPGTTLKLPGNETSAPVASASPPPAYAAPERELAQQTPTPTPGEVRLGEVTPPPASSASAAPSTPQQPTLLNGNGTAAPERVAKAETPGSANDAVSPSNAQVSGSVAGSRLRWPVAGKIISGFGPRPDGTHNDGVNLAAPMGTDIHAAESGVVAYAGDELKGYGNLVLVRHDNGWVTAYAHADEILVKRGDQIKRGQVIAKAGRTGQVDQPQVHFEVRQGQKPVDPTPFMERL
ncbi:peptidoglycan DD-metalloendopeptidase family protein [Hyphomicrobium sp.]|uniref:peptidoglycan DD-metalloendopeptidase family protein n=1 Tax=Hyphomicrobium sp. TaxID=82 RepID=UPI002E36A98F|nr:peptidoglycan DD-metalloendopeptidase family protein [Hyphomicrobium sp.]HEX2843560.1 peptidoglycan DD-metalloendopeptidase family protein [Hyphomicrobium sp.]